ncbi:hypothetical protein [Streptomyces sp. AGS-58]|uniref:hypothetical protein n=1 Tax=unclassified Streptomyces TaxID=2593676 RepID=UPI0035A2F683
MEPDTPRPSIPLLEAVVAAYDAAVSHATSCGTCWPGMLYADMCPDGQRAAIAGLDAVKQCRTVAGHLVVRRYLGCGERLERTLRREHRTSL